MLRKTLILLSFITLLPVQVIAATDAGSQQIDAGQTLQLNDPKVVVQTAVSGVINALKARKDQNALSAEDRAAIRKAIGGYFDFVEMARRALGRPWRKMDIAQKKDFVLTFRELLERSYGNRLSEYHDQQVEYGKVKIGKRTASVDSEVIDADKRIPVRYKLVHKKIGWRVYDIKVEGISMINTYRTDFGEAVNKNGIVGFLKDLKERVAGLEKQDKPNG